MPSLQVRKLRHRKVKALAQSCRASGEARLWGGRRPWSSRRRPCCLQLVLFTTAEHFFPGGWDEVRSNKRPCSLRTACPWGITVPGTWAEDPQGTVLGVAFLLWLANDSLAMPESREPVRYDSHLLSSLSRVPQSLSQDCRCFRYFPQGRLTWERKHHKSCRCCSSYVLWPGRWPSSSTMVCVWLVLFLGTLGSPGMEKAQLPQEAQGRLVMLMMMMMIMMMTMMTTTTKMYFL